MPSGFHLSQLEAEERIRKVHGEKYDLSKFIFKNQRTKAVLICHDHGNFLATPKDVWQGSGCPICSKTKVKPIRPWGDVSRVLSDLHGEALEFFPNTYLGVTRRITVKCRFHQHIWEPLVSELLKGTGCPKCRYLKSGDKLRTSVSEFIERATSCHGDKYNYTKVHQFGSIKENVSIVCPTHGEFIQSAQSHIGGSGCPKCAFEQSSKSQTENWQDVLESFRRTHGDFYEYNWETYRNSATKMEIICPVHGKFLQMPVMHKSGQGCPKCGKVKIANSLTTQWNDVFQSFTSFHGNKYVYYPETYTVLEQPMAMECRKHGKFFQTPKNHRNGSGCPICNSSKGEKIIERKLRDLGIEFVHQKKFPDLSNYLRFDFFIPTLNLVIEFNGLQHYEPVVYFGGEKSLVETKRRDSIKLNYCLEKGISHEIIRFDDDLNIRIKEIIDKHSQ